jgi:hypothetical protein
LDKLSFKAPANPNTVEITNPSLPSAAGVYKISVSNFNKITESGTPVTYNINSATKFALLYVEGDSGDVVINSKITATVPGNNLLLITDLPVKITKDVGELSQAPLLPIYAVYNRDASPDIEMAIISSKKITVEKDASVSDKTVTPDRAIMLQGPFVSLDKLEFQRDAGYHNDEFPINAVRYNPMYLYNITNLERAYPMLRSYTGIAIYDTQWVYDED